MCCSNVSKLVLTKKIDNFFLHLCASLDLFQGQGHWRCWSTKYSKRWMKFNNLINFLFPLPVCLNNPDRGRRSKYCVDHAGERPSPTIAEVDLRPITRLWAKKMAEKKLLEETAVVHAQECKLVRNVKRFHNTTAG